jgi:hypothetical protein
MTLVFGKADAREWMDGWRIFRSGSTRWSNLWSAEAEKFWKGIKLWEIGNGDGREWARTLFWDVFACVEDGRERNDREGS